jgi:hypothetical protein
MARGHDARVFELVEEPGRRRSRSGPDAAHERGRGAADRHTGIQRTVGQVLSARRTALEVGPTPA